MLHIRTTETIHVINFARIMLHKASIQSPKAAKISSVGKVYYKSIAYVNTSLPAIISRQAV